MSSTTTVQARLGRRLWLLFPLSCGLKADQSRFGDEGCCAMMRSAGVQLCAAAVTTQRTWQRGSALFRVCGCSSVCAVRAAHVWMLHHASELSLLQSLFIPWRTASASVPQLRSSSSVGQQSQSCDWQSVSHEAQRQSATLSLSTGKRLRCMHHNLSIEAQHETTQSPEPLQPAFPTWISHASPPSLFAERE